MTEIPPEITRIGDDCFSERNDISKLVIPNTVKSIGNQCFRNLDNLTRVVLSTNLKRISWHCFEDLETKRDKCILHNSEFCSFNLPEKKCGSEWGEREEI